MAFTWFRHQIVPYAIQKLQAAGYRLVTVAECLGIQAYKTVGSPGTPNVRSGASPLTKILTYVANAVYLALLTIHIIIIIFEHMDTFVT